MLEVQTEKLEAKIEAILFTMGEAVEVERIAVALEQEESVIRDIIQTMIKRYEEEDRGIQIVELDGAFQMCTKASMYETLIKIAHIPKKHVLTDILLETLSIIAYKQPITKQEIEAIRGVKTDHAVNKLVEYNLVCEVGRMNAPGRPIMFGTTEEFLRSFGVQSLEDLPMPTSDKVEDFKMEAEEEVSFKLEVGKE